MNQITLKPTADQAADRQQVLLYQASDGRLVRQLPSGSLDSPFFLPFSHPFAMLPNRKSRIALFLRANSPSTLSNMGSNSMSSSSSSPMAGQPSDRIVSATKFALKSLAWYKSPLQALAISSSHCLRVTRSAPVNYSKFEHL